MTPAPAPSPFDRGGPGRKRAETAEYREKREAIVAAAAAVFHEKGYTAGSLDDVAARLNTRKASLYHYVRSKAHLLELVFASALRDAQARIGALAAVPDPAARLEALIRLQVEMVTADLSHFAVFFDHVSALPDRQTEDSSELRALERRYFRQFVDTVADAVAAGSLPAVDAHYAAQAVMGMTSWTYKWFDPARHDAGALADTCVALICAPRAKPAESTPPGTPPHG